jgi:hypothetical protein
MTKVIISILLISLSYSIQAQQTIEYDWLTLGKKSGSMSVKIIDENHTVATFEFNDRGRGPMLVDEIWLNDDLTIQKEIVTGHAYMGAKVNEVFSFTNNVAKWQNSMEHGSQKVLSKAFYSSAEGAPYSFELLVKAILATKDNSLQLLPSGEASLERILTTEISKGSQSMQVTLIAVNGFGFTPSYGWFDEQNNLFGLALGWMGMARSDWGESIDKLQELQDKVEDDYFKAKASEFGESLSGVTLIKNIDVFTATDKGLIKKTNVLLKNGKILAVTNVLPKIKIDKTINGKGKTLMPGLWDMHTHISLQAGFLNIAAGVTSVRDMANEHDKVMQATKLFETGKAIGPSIYRAGFIDKKSPYSAPTGKLAETLEDALAYVDWYAKRGYQQIKIYSSIDPTWVKAIAKRTHHHKMKLSGHIPSFMTTEQAILDGFDEIQHINMIFLNFLADDKSDTRTPLRFTLVGDKAGDLDLESKEVNDFIALLKERDIIVDSTATIFEGMFLNKAGEIDPSYVAIADYMPTDVRRQFLAGDLDINDKNEEAYAKSSVAVLRLIKKLFDAGVRLVPGTDAMAGFTLHRELELYVKAGIPNADVLKIATVNSARVAGQNNVGTIDIDQTADIILLEGNPLENISNIRKVALVIKGERLFRPSNLYRSIGIKPFTTDE